MVSTYLNYRLFAADLDTTLVHKAAEKITAREATYYADNIGKVKTVDDFLKNQRIYAYAMKAYGLEDMAYAKGFMRKVLESDQSDSRSFVNLLVDPRFLTFAKAFNFKTDGSIATVAASAQDASHEIETLDMYDDRRIALGATAKTTAASFQNAIGSIQSVDALLGNQQLFDFALKAYGIDSAHASKATIRGVLTSDLSDPNSLANQLTDDRYRDLAAAFNFEADGSVVAGGTSQTSAQTTDTIFAYYDNNDLASSPAAGKFKSDYYQGKLATISSVDDLLADDKLFDFVTTSVGLEPAYQSKTLIRDVLTSDLSDPNSAANTLSSASYRTLRAAFNFNADGSLDAGVSAQTTEQKNTTINGYIDNFDNSAAKRDKFETNYYKIAISNVSSVEQLQRNTKLYKVALLAYGLDPLVDSKSKIAKALTSDLSDPFSFANASSDKRLKALAQAFNFDKTGTSQIIRKAQTDDAKLATARLYSTKIGDATAQLTSTKNENKYYGEGIDNLRSVDGLIADSRLKDYVLKAYGFKSSDLSDTTLRKILTSDLLDKDSFANKAENLKFRTLALDFNFDKDGSIRRVSLNQAQDRNEQVRTVDQYVRQSVEEDAGNQSETTRLALYFQRKAPTLTSAYSILADKALLQVVRTALGLPESFSNSDIDVQAKAINKRLTLDDFKDKAKVDKFIARFSAIYDAQNPDTSASSLVASLFNN